MENIKKSPWTAVVIAIVVMTIGYTFYLQKEGALAAGNLYHCPMEEMCKKAGCNGGEDCKRGECASCPFCMNEAS